MAKVIIIFGNNKHIKDFFEKKIIAYLEKRIIAYFRMPIQQKNPPAVYRDKSEIRQGDINIEDTLFKFYYLN